MKIIKVPSINGLEMTNGTELAPDAISETGEKIQLNPDNIEEREKEIYNFVNRLKERAIFLGGDHSISYPITKALNKKYSNLKLIILDAHPDLMPPMRNPTHEEWLRAAIIAGIKPENVLLIGTRNIDINETKSRVQMIPIDNIESSKDNIKEFVKNSSVYLSIDIDFFDSSVAPATGYPETNGASKGEGLDLIEFIIKNSNIIGADIVEVNPTKKGAKKTLKLAKDVLETLKNGIN